MNALQQCNLNKVNDLHIRIMRQYLHGPSILSDNTIQTYHAIIKILPHVNSPQLKS